jgi:hypothetical protein
MKKPKLRSSPNGSFFNLMRVLCLPGILLLAAGTALTCRTEAQAKPVRAPVGQGEEVVQFRATPRVHSPESTNEYTTMEDLLFPQLLISFENNTVSGSASVSTSFYYLVKDWTGEGSIDIEGTYDPETGVVEGTMNYYLIYRFPPDPGFHDIRRDVHYYGAFKSWYEDPAGKFSLEDATLDLFMVEGGMVASDRYFDNISDISHSENPAAIFIHFVRETPDASDCAPSVYGLDPLVPGDVISPGASYTDQDGNDVNIIGERWFFNGQDANSVVWDGNKVTVELQWTCLGHQAHSQTFEIPAYEAPPPPAGQDPNQPASGEPSSGQPPSGGPASPGSGFLGKVFGGLLVGLGGVAGLGGLLGLGIPLVKTLTAGLAAVAVVTPPAQAPAAPSNPSTPRPGKLDPALRKPWDLKIDNLIDQRTGIQAQIQPINDQIIRLTRLYKNNILKVIMKGGLETGQILFDAASGGTSEAPNIAFEIGKKALGDKLSDKSYQKHDTSQDGKNVVNIKNLIDNLKGQREGFRNQVRDINREIKNIQTYIRTEF